MKRVIYQSKEYYELIQTMIKSGQYQIETDNTGQLIIYTSLFLQSGGTLVKDTPDPQFIGEDH